MSEFSVEADGDSWVVLDNRRYWGPRLVLAHFSTEVEANTVRDYEQTKLDAARQRADAAEAERRALVEAGFAEGRARIEGLDGDGARARLLAVLELHHPTSSGDCPTCRWADGDHESFPCGAFDQLTRPGADQ